MVTFQGLSVLSQKCNHLSEYEQTFLYTIDKQNLKRYHML